MKFFRKREKEKIFNKLAIEKQSYIRYLNTLIQDLNLKIIETQQKLQLLENKLNNDDQTLCSVCMEEKINCAFIPCGHTFCNKCILRNSNNAIFRCFLCRHQVFQYLKIYL